ncbi:hypothetical protein BGX31_007772 [Mortierella sp. GBA43]|nr:hypothetical protein BGX31_007772 [Mortierella sp. GBA43]
MDDSTNPGNNLFVNSLAIKTETSDLEDLFGKYGKVEKVQIMTDPHTRESRGFAFVTMVRGEDAEAALQAKRGRARTPTPGQYRGPPKRDRPMGMPYSNPHGGGGGGPVRDYGGRPPYDRYDRDYDRWMGGGGGGGGGGRPRYDDRPPRDYRPPYGMDRGGYDDRSMYDRGYDRRPRYDERYDRY